MSELTLLLVFIVAAAVAGLGGWLSLRADRLAEPPQRRRRRRRPAVGTVVAFATVAGALGIAPPSGTTLRLVAVAILLAGVGALADRRPLRPGLRVSAEAVAATAAVLLGLETGATGTAVTNLALVVGFVVVVVESLRLLDAAPRAAAVVAAPAVAALAAVADAAGQDGVATAALALAGGLVGLVAAGARRPFQLGESGCLFTGFLLATLIVAVNPTTPAPLSLLVLLPLIAVPVLNATMVTVDRLRRRHRLTERRPDGLPHRLRAVPLSWPLTLLLLGAAQILITGVVVLAERNVVPAVAPIGVTAVAALLLLMVAARSRVRRRTAVGVSPTARLVGLGLAAAFTAALVPAALVLVVARGGLAEGAAATERGLAAAGQGEVEASVVAFDQAEAAFASAADRLDSPLASLGLAVPVLGPNLSAARTVSALGAELATTGVNVATEAPRKLRIAGGRIPVEEIRRLVPDLTEAAEVLRRGATTTDGIETAFLLPTVRDRVADLDVRLEVAAETAELAASAAAVVPGIFGGDEPRRYFLAIQNNAELRATGGFIGSYAELVAEDGALRIEHIGRHQDLNEGGPEVKDLRAPQDYLDRYRRFEVASTWESVNLSPDLPTVGGVIAGLYPQSGGRPIDGVIAIDPIGLAAILRLTGPIDVKPWPVPITPDNVVEVTLNQSYIEFDQNDDDRIDFIGEVARMAVDAFTTADLGSPTAIFDALGGPARGGHLAAWFTRDEEQALMERVGVASEIELPAADSLLVVNQNAAGNKIDYYFRRTTSYDVQLQPEPEGGRLDVSARVRVVMENQAPAEGLPRYVIGPFNERFEAGQNYSYMSLYSPLGVTDATWDGAPLQLVAEQELGRNVYSAFLSIPARSTRTLEMQLQGSVDAEDGGWYELDLLHQPLLVDEEVSVSVSVAPGWRIAEAEGARLEGDDGAVASLVLARDEAVRVRLVAER